MRARGVAPRARRARRAGFSMLSVMVASAVLVVGVLALGRTGTLLVRSQSTSATRSEALALARAQVEALRGQDPWTVATQAPVRLDRDGEPAADGVYTRAVVVREERPNLLQVTVTVAGVRSTAPVELTTFIYRGAK